MNCMFLQAHHYSNNMFCAYCKKRDVNLETIHVVDVYFLICTTCYSMQLPSNGGKAILGTSGELIIQKIPRLECTKKVSCAYCKQRDMTFETIHVVDRYFILCASCSSLQLPSNGGKAILGINGELIIQKLPRSECAFE